jgi:hypothetical protein
MVHQQMKCATVSADGKTVTLVGNPPTATVETVTIVSTVPRVWVAGSTYMIRVE